MNTRHVSYNIILKYKCIWIYKTQFHFKKHLSFIVLYYSCAIT